MKSIIWCKANEVLIRWKMLYKGFVAILIIQTVCGAPVDEGTVDFSKHKVLRILPKDSQSFELLKKIKSEYEVKIAINFNIISNQLLLQTKIDFWNAPVSDLRPVLSLIGPKDTYFLETLNKSSIAYEIVSNNFQKLIDDQKAENNVFYGTGFDYEHKYHSYDEIKNELHSVAQSKLTMVIQLW